MPRPITQRDLTHAASSPSASTTQAAAGGRPPLPPNHRERVAEYIAQDRVTARGSQRRTMLEQMRPVFELSERQRVCAAAESHAMVMQRFAEELRLSAGRPLGYTDRYIRDMVLQAAPYLNDARIDEPVRRNIEELLTEEIVPRLAYRVGQMPPAARGNVRNPSLAKKMMQFRPEGYDPVELAGQAVADDTATLQHWLDAGNVSHAEITSYAKVLLHHFQHDHGSENARIKLFEAYQRLLFSENVSLAAPVSNLLLAQIERMFRSADDENVQLRAGTALFGGHRYFPNTYEIEAAATYLPKTLAHFDRAVENGTEELEHGAALLNNVIAWMAHKGVSLTYKQSQEIYRRALALAKNKSLSGYYKMWLHVELVDMLRFVRTPANLEQAKEILRFGLSAAAHAGKPDDRISWMYSVLAGIQDETLPHTADFDAVLVRRALNTVAGDQADAEARAKIAAELSRALLRQSLAPARIPG